MTRLRRLPALLLTLNWLALVAAFGWTCKVQGQLLWWLRLDWSGWAGEFAAMAELGAVPAGSLWLLWMLVSVLWGWMAALGPEAQAAPAAPSVTAATAEAARRQLASPSDLMQTRPELKDKVLRLHQSLEKL